MYKSPDMILLLMKSNFSFPCFVEPRCRSSESFNNAALMYFCSFPCVVFIGLEVKEEDDDEEKKLLEEFL